MDAVVGPAVGETVILLRPPLPLVGASIETMGECQQNDGLADGQVARLAAKLPHGAASHWAPLLIRGPVLISSANPISPLANAVPPPINHQ